MSLRRLGVGGSRGKYLLVQASARTCSGAFFSSAVNPEIETAIGVLRTLELLLGICSRPCVVVPDKREAAWT